MKKSVLMAGMIVVSALIAGTAAHGAEPDPAVKKIFDSLLSAIQANDVKAFSTDATEAVKKGMTEKIMEGLNKDLGARLKAGYEATYLCELNQQGHKVYLWKLSFKDKGDNVVIRIAMKDGKVGGFFLQ